MEIESKTLLKFETKMTKKRPQKKKKRNIYSYSNREASLTEASVSSVAAQQHFRWAARIATQRKP
jgi:hypothetical protein